jgi:hypothetical protein
VPNKSFKPKLLRSGNGAAEEACHAVTCATQFGLTHVLGRAGERLCNYSALIFSALANVMRLVVGRWSLVVGRWSLVVGRWSLVVGRWSLVVGKG